MFVDFCTMPCGRSGRNVLLTKLNYYLLYLKSFAISFSYLPDFVRKGSISAHFRSKIAVPFHFFSPYDAVFGCAKLSTAHYSIIRNHSFSRPQTPKLPRRNQAKYSVIEQPHSSAKLFRIILADNTRHYKHRFGCCGHCAKAMSGLFLNQARLCSTASLRSWSKWRLCASSPFCLASAAASRIILDNISSDGSSMSVSL